MNTVVSTSPWAILMAGVLCMAGSGWAASVFLDRAVRLHKLSSPEDLLRAHESETGFGLFLAITFILLALAATVFFVGAAWRLNIIN